MEVLEDNKLFRRIGLVKELNLSLNCSANEFRNGFENNVGDGQTFVGIKRPKKEFQGSIGRSAFKMHRSITMFDSNLSGTSGTFAETDNKLKVNVWIYLPIGTFLIYSVLILTMNIIFATVFLSINKAHENVWPFIGGLYILFTLSTSLFPYLTFRNGVKKLTFEVERELNYWAIKHSQQ